MKQKRNAGHIPWLAVGLILSVVALLVQLGPEAWRILHEWPRPGRQTMARATLALNDGTKTEVRYYLYLPNRYPGNQRWPLLLYLHGSGARGNDLAKVQDCGPAGLIAKGDVWPMIVITPQCPEGTSWDPQQLMALLDQVEQRWAVDPDRVFVGGFSMGGFGTWALACAAPERFAAIVPVAGGGDPTLADRLVHLPTWAFHGDADDVVPKQQTIRMIEGIQSKGGTPTLTIYEGFEHAIDQLTFSRQDLHDWLLQQRRSAASEIKVP